MEENRTCALCDKPLKGRVDKKFCNDFCRNEYNNKLKKPDREFIRNITNALKKNRRILEQIIINTNRPTVKISLQQLNQWGFQFKYHTHTYTTKQGKTYFYCYDHGYLPLENNWYLVVKKQQ
jgi:hypothetical protein